MLADLKTGICAAAFFMLSSCSGLWPVVQMTTGIRRRLH
jgi:hypothetical protein